MKPQRERDYKELLFKILLADSWKSRSNNNPIIRKIPPNGDSIFVEYVSKYIDLPLNDRSRILYDTHQSSGNEKPTTTAPLFKMQ